eukprot:scaffold28127_cov76-Amphora_coffeaeformis.AAC.1
MSYLARQVGQENITVNVVHPGVIDTGLGEMNGLTGCLLRGIKRLFWKTPNYGAIAPCWAALDPENEKASGQFFNEKVPMALAESVSDLQVQKEWIQWTRDFLARSDINARTHDGDC